MLGQILKSLDVHTVEQEQDLSDQPDNRKENHLHWGMQLIFDESQKECDNEIWIDIYAITKLLEKNKSAVIRNNETKEYYRENDFDEDSLQSQC